MSRVTYNNRTVFSAQLETDGDVTLMTSHFDGEGQEEQVERYLTFEDLETLYFAAQAQRKVASMGVYETSESPRDRGRRFTKLRKAYLTAARGHHS
ncbi:MAG: hypothetical protein MN733_30175 [Nitrososphaera sp.]|nr:hypothetical protein [Nitrososphaera sp.]